MLSFPLIRYVLTAAFRDRLVMTFAVLIVLATALSVFLGSTGMTEKDSFALVFGANGLRFLTVTGTVLFISFYMRRSFETKEVEFLLSRPVSRLSFLASHVAAFFVLCLLMSVLATLAVSFLGHPDRLGMIVWGFSVFIENIVIAMVALFFSMVLTSAAGSALAAFGFYVLSRLIGTLLGIAAQPAQKMVFAVLNSVMEVISVFVPRLDMMAQTSWLVYGVDGSGGVGMMEGGGRIVQIVMAQIGIGGFIALQGVLFVLLFFFASAYDFLRRQF